ncbi:MAG: methylmalonyl-CoA epimerase [Caldibacillus debilis]|nr:MAG: methylmalonyl-CoA epimerase [Caldibacillus debilis]
MSEQGGAREVKGVDHIGIAVRSLEEALPFYTGVLPFKLVKMETVESEQVRVAFLDAGNCKIELLEPAGEDGPVAKFLEKRGEGIHHVAFETDSIHQTIQQLAERGARMVSAEPKEGASGALVAFIHPKSAGGVLYEVCQKRKK